MNNALKLSEDVRVGEIDGSTSARVMPERERRMMYHRGEFYRQFKHYQGMFCLGVSWEKCDQDGRRM